MYVLSLGEEMVIPHISIRADSGNIDRHIRKVTRAMGVITPTTVKKGGGRRHGRCSICPTAKDRKTDWKCYHCSEWMCKDHSIKTIQITYDNCKE
jgi:hypothetical protein